MTRRTLFHTTAAAGSLLAAGAQTTRKGRLQQGVAQWCFNKMPLDELCQLSVRLGIKGIDLVGPADWPTLKKYGLVPSMVSGGHSIPDGMNRKENHDKIEKAMREAIDHVAAAGAPNVIAFSGNRRGMPDEEGADNSVICLNRLKKYAEDKSVTICVELLNSKDHKDYMCDHTAWGVGVCKRVDSPRVKLLYDIYHMQRMEGEIIRTIRDNIQYIGHFHTGGCPGRNEIDQTQELNYRTIAEAVAALNFKGFFSHEFVPKRDPAKSLEEAVAICDV